MKIYAGAEIHFHEQEKVSVFFESNSTGKEEWVGELMLLGAYTNRMLVNLGGKNEATHILANTLIKCGEDLSEIERQIDCELVDYRGVPGRKRFIAKLNIKDEDISFNLKAKGFGILARGVGYYAPVSIFMLAKHLILRRRGDTDYLGQLSEIMSYYGSLFFKGDQ